MRYQSGFTLIELVMVIVILGLLSAVAIPKFVDLSDDAEDAAIAGMVGGLNSAAGVNFATKATGNTATTVTDCQHAGALLAGGASGIPAPGYTIASLTTGLTIEGDTIDNCVLTHTASSKTANFIATRVD